MLVGRRKNGRKKPSETGFFGVAGMRGGKNLGRVVRIVVVLMTMTMTMTLAAQTQTWNMGSIIADFDDGTLTISGSGAMTNWTSLYAVPWNSVRSSINTVIIEDDVTTIGNYAFQNCTNLTTIAISNNVTAIGNSAFQNCTNLTSVTIPNSVAIIGVSAFQRCTNLTSVTIGTGVTSISFRAFSECSSLTTVNFNAINCLYISEVFFSSPFTTLNIGDNVTQIPNGAFIGFMGTSVTIPYSVLSIGDEAFRNCSALASITIPNSVTSIGTSAFMHCTRLSSVAIGNNVQTIGNYAFSNCSSLVFVNIPKSVTIIGENAFSNCSALASITVHWDSPLDIDKSVFNGIHLNSTHLKVSQETKEDYAKTSVWKDFYIDGSSLLSGPLGANLNWTFDIIDGSLKISGTGQMMSFSDEFGYYIADPPWYPFTLKIRKLTICNEVTSISNRAFLGCVFLASVTIGNSVQAIGMFAFSDCTSLSSITIPNSVTFIGERAFRSCRFLTSVIIGSGVSLMNYDVFGNCTRLTEINVVADNSHFSSIDGVLFNKDQSILRKYPEGRLGKYNIPNSVTKIGMYAFSESFGLTAVTIPNSVISIGWGAFISCVSLANVTIPDSVIDIYGSVFSGCTSLKSATIGSNVQTIGDYVFANCINLSDITNLAIKPQSIPLNLFSNIPNNAKLHVPVCSENEYRASIWNDLLIMPIESEITIDSHPTHTTEVYAPSINGSLHVIASVTPVATPLSYQWYSNATYSNEDGYAITTERSENNFFIPTNLTAGIYYYYCIVRTCDSFVKSDVATVVVITTPSEPQEFSATPYNRQVTLSWSTPSNNGGSVITGYEISSDNGANWVYASSNDSHIFTNLTTCTSYNFRVRAVNIAGHGADVSVSATTFCAPSAPLNLITTSGNRQISISWSAPENDGGSKIVGYQVSSNNSNNWVNAQSHSGHVFTDLELCEDYIFHVRAINIVDEGAKASTSAMTFCVPEVPTNLSAASGNLQITLSWNEPLNSGGSAITKYEISHNDGANWIDASSNDSHIFTNLLICTSYTFIVRAVNSVGPGADVSVSTSTFCVPDAPTSLTTIPDNAQVTISWSTPTFDGGSNITEYEVQLNNDQWIESSGITGHTFTGLTNGVAYDFRVRAVNAAGSGVESSATATPRTVPDAPLEFTAIPGNALVTLSWSAPYNGGSEIIRYEVRRDNLAWIHLTGDTRSHTFTGLSNGSQYTFHVRAYNEAGYSSVEDINETPCTTPSAPLNFSAFPGNTQVTLSWTAPNNTGGSAIIEYEVSSNDGASWVTAQSNTGHTFTDLNNGTSYIFIVRAVNSVGPGTASLRMWETPRTIPDPPQNFATTPGDRRVSLSWDAPAYNGGSQISRYEVSLDGTWTSLSNSNTRSYTFLNLTNGESYNFCVRALNVAGHSEEVCLLGIIPFTSPSPPQDFIVTTDNAQATLTWATPENNGGRDILHYEVSVNSATSFETASSDFEHTFYDLTFGTLYTFRVRAVNVAGGGAVAQATAIPRTVPDVPQSFRATPGDGQVRLDWNAPTTTGGSPILGYEISLYNGETEAIASNITNYTFSGLTNGVEYIFKVRAVNAIGSGAEATLTAIPPLPVITVTGQPRSPVNLMMGNIGSSERLNVSANVTPHRERSFQWYINTENTNTGGTAIEGETSNIFTIPVDLSAGTYYYYCEISAGEAIPVFSNVSTVSVAAALITISSQPRAVVNVSLGGEGYEWLFVTANVTPSRPLSYQWHINTENSNTGGVAVDGATGRQFLIPDNLAAGIYYYFCEINADGAFPVRSDVVAVYVTTPVTAVNNIANVHSNAVIGIPLTLAGSVVPSNATNQTIVWSVQNAGSTGATITGNTLNTTAAGTVAVRAVIINGLALDIDYSQIFNISVRAPFVTVTNISDVSATAVAGTPLTLAGTVVPTDATNQAIIWSVQSAGTTGATITGNTLNTTAAGTVTVRATVTNGASASRNYTQDFTITVSGVTNVSELSSTNPLRAWMRGGLLHVSGLEIGELLSIYNAVGALVYNSVADSEEIDIPWSAEGVFIIRSGENTVRVVVSL